MCGITGFVGTPAPERLPLEHLGHRGPDYAGEIVLDSCRLGHTRLAIIDLDSAANQPMRLPDAGLSIVFNGEIYNYLELRSRFLRDETFFSSSDTEVLLRLWAKLGTQTLKHLRGMFAFAVWDEKKHTLHIARDRLGKKPLVYFAGSNTFAFASELNALVRMLPNTPQISPQALDLYLSYQFIPAPFTIYRGVFKLPPASLAVWKDSELKIEPYWQPDFQTRPYPDEEELLNIVEAGVKDAVRIRLRADVPVGALLSGGVDSGLVTAMAALEYGRKLHTFSVGFEEEDFNELPFALEVARKYGCEHHPVVLNQSMAASRIDDVVSSYGEPFGDKSALPSMLICEQAARHLKVVLNGDGGDESFAGYTRYRLNAFRRLIGRLAIPAHKTALKLEAVFASGLSGHRFGKAFMRASRMLSPMYKVLRFDDFFNLADKRRFYQPEFLAAAGNATADYETGLLCELSGIASRPEALVFAADYRHYLAGDLLPKMDIASMRHSLEARSPLLDQEVFALGSSIPYELRLKNNTEKYLLKKVAERYIPHDLIHRPKQGFSIPVGKWLREVFHPDFRDLLSSVNHPAWGYLRRDEIESSLDAHRQGAKGLGFKLWLVFLLGLWFNKTYGKQDEATRHNAFRVQSTK